MTRLSRAFLALAPLAVLAAGGCVTFSTPKFLMEPAYRDWDATVDRARALAADGRAAQADSLLASYATAYPTAPQAIETNYWRALFDLTAPPANQRAMLATPLLQKYLAAGQPIEHWSEATALLRTVSRIDTLSRVAATYVSRGDVAADAAATAGAKATDAKAEVKAAADNKAQDDEIKRLRDELAKSKEELERIKKRLAEPPKKPPTP